ncbi:MAG: tail fiber domain-containing protein [Pyrinomonadaceae bacterium]
MSWITKNAVYSILMLLLFASVSLAQSSAFSYQGYLEDNGTPANGNYDFFIQLYDAPTGGSAIGPTFTPFNVQVVNGIYTLICDFGLDAGGNPVWNGTSRFLDIAIKRTGEGSGSFVTLTPRVRILNTPYAIRSLEAGNADKVGYVPVSQLVRITDPRLADARNPLPGSNSYVWNGTTRQSNAGFNIDGDGTLAGNLKAKIVNVSDHLQFNGVRVLTETAAGNLSLGFNTPFAQGGGGNTIVGDKAGEANTTGGFNSLFGWHAGNSLTTANGNSFFGSNSGLLTTTAGSNSFFGSSSGESNTTGSNNAFFGESSGKSNTVGTSNTYYGRGSGLGNSTGNENSVFGSNAGLANTASFNAFFGSLTGRFNTSGSENTFYGTGAGFRNTTGNLNVFVGRLAGENNTTGSNNTFVGSNAGGQVNSLSFATAIGSGAVVTGNNTIQLGRQNLDKVRIGLLGAAGSTSLCLNFGNEIASCSSSIRYKKNIEPLELGGEALLKLRPVRFVWKGDGAIDIGFVAEEVADAVPVLATRNLDGEIEGIRYDRIGAILVNGFKEHQSQIDELGKKAAEQEATISDQKREIEDLKAQIRDLKKLVCQNSTAEACKEEEK